MAFDQPLKRFIDRVCRIFLSKLPNELPNAGSRSYGGSKRAIEFTVQKKLPIFGIEADNVGRKYVNREILRKPGNILFAEWRVAVCAISCNDTLTRAGTSIASSVDHH
jgi:hypothetical protein